MTSIHSRIRQARNAKDMTQQQLANAVAVHLKSVSDWETGATPRDPMLAKIASALDVTVDYLRGTEPAPEENVLTILANAKAKIGKIMGISETRFDLTVSFAT